MHRKSYSDWNRRDEPFNMVVVRSLRVYVDSYKERFGSLPQIRTYDRHALNGLIMDIAGNKTPELIEFYVKSELPPEIPRDRSLDTLLVNRDLIMELWQRSRDEQP